MIDHKDIEAIAKTLRQYGVDYIKTANLEMRMGKGESVTPLPIPIFKEASQAQEQENIIKHKVEEMKSVMKLSDEELIDSLFPVKDEESDEVIE